MGHYKDKKLMKWNYNIKMIKRKVILSQIKEDMLAESVTRSFTSKHSDQQKIYYQAHIPDNPSTKDAILIIPGLAEHGRREHYLDIAQKANKEGIPVYIIDPRGQGLTGLAADSLGFFAEENGWQATQDDIFQLLEIIQEKHPDAAINILAHSMGSLLTRTMLATKNKDLDHINLRNIVFSGTGGYPGLLGKVGSAIASLIKTKNYITNMSFSKARYQPSSAMNKLLFGLFNSKFSAFDGNDEKNGYEWLNPNPQHVQKYINDPLCGYISSIQLYWDLVYNVSQLQKLETGISALPSSIKNIVFWSGAEDPVGWHPITQNFKVGVQQVIDVYEGLKSNQKPKITSKFIEGARHEAITTQPVLDHLLTP